MELLQVMLDNLCGMAILTLCVLIVVSAIGELVIRAIRASKGLDEEGDEDAEKDS